MKTKHVLALVTTLAVAANCTPLWAARNDDARIVAAAKKSYVYRTYLKDDDIKIQSTDGAVTLKGEVCDRSHKDRPRTWWKACPVSRVSITGWR